MIIDAPSEADPTKSDAGFRERICEVITSSRFFCMWHLVPIDTKELWSNRNHPEYSEVFKQIYSPASLENSYNYQNSYREETFQLAKSQHPFMEHVFICPIKDSSNEFIRPLYVSKEYNVGPFGEHLYKPGRFLFGNFTPNHSHPYVNVMLVENPAIVFTEPNFNVEIYYLQMRKNTKPGMKFNKTR